MSGSRRSNAELLQQLEEKNPLLGLGCSYSPYPVRLWIQDINHPRGLNSLNCGMQ